MDYVFVALGAACGGALRYWTITLLQNIREFHFPLATLVVNVLGSFILAFLIFVFDMKGIMLPKMRIMLTVGLCGGYTTFSTFSMETINLLIAGKYLLSFLNISLNILLSFAAIFLAYQLSKLF